MHLTGLLSVLSQRELDLADCFGIRAAEAGYAALRHGDRAELLVCIVGQDAGGRRRARAVRRARVLRLRQAPSVSSRAELLCVCAGAEI